MLLNSKLEEGSRLLSGNPNSLEVREEENYWRGMAAFTASWQQQLLTWANDSQNAINMVDAQEPVWAATLEENKDNHDLGPVVTVMEDNLTEIRRLRKQAQDVLQSAVKLQIKVGSFDQTAGTMVVQLSAARAKLKGHLLDRDSLPLWKLSSRRQMGESNALFHSFNTRLISVSFFLTEHWPAFVFLLAVFVGTAILARQMHMLVRDKQPADELESQAFRILRHWIAVSMLPPLLLGYVLSPSAPITLMGFIIMLSFFPILVLLATVDSRAVTITAVRICGIVWLQLVDESLWGLRRS